MVAGQYIFSIFRELKYQWCAGEIATFELFWPDGVPQPIEL